MTVTFRNMNNGADTSNVSVYNTGSINPGANKRIYLAILANAPSGGTAGLPTVTGLGLTWTLTRQTPDPSALKTLFWLRADTGASAPTAGALTMTFPSSLNGVCWGVVEVSGSDQTAQTMASVEERRQGSTNTSVSFPWTTTPAATSGALAAVGINEQDTITPGSGWTALGTTASHSAPTQALQMMCASSAPSLVAASWTTAGNTWTIAVEVPAELSGPTNLDDLRAGSSLVGLRAGSSTPSKVYAGTTQVWP